MPFSVLVEHPDGAPVTWSDKKFRVYDVRRRKVAYKGPVLYNVSLEWRDYETKNKDSIPLVRLLKSDSGLTVNWWTLTGDRLTSVRGFATMRYAIEHELRRQGYWKDD